MNYINAKDKLNTGYRSTIAEILSFIISEIYPEEGIRILRRNVGCRSQVTPNHNADDLASLLISAVLCPFCQFLSNSLRTRVGDAGVLSV